jgi:large subunit ribosomal protein L4
MVLKEGRLTVVENMDLGEVKTKKLAGVLTALKTGKKTLVVDDRENMNLKLSIRNMPESRYLPPEGVNVYDLLRHDHILLSKAAAKALEARCLEHKS